MVCMGVRKYKTKLKTNKKEIKSTTTLSANQTTLKKTIFKKRSGAGGEKRRKKKSKMGCKCYYLICTGYKNQIKLNKNAKKQAKLLRNHILSIQIYSFS